MGKGDKKSRKGKIIAGSYGKKRRRKAGSAKKIPVSVLGENDQTEAKTAVRQEVGFPSGESENLEPVKKPRTRKKTEE